MPLNALDVITDFIQNPWTIISLIFWICVGILIFLLRKRKENYYLFFPLLVLFKTKRLNKFITKIGKNHPRFWKIFWTIGIFVSFGFTIYAYWYFTKNFIELIFTPSIRNIVAPLIPGVTIDLPVFAFLFLPLLFIVTTHELAHGISASAENVEVKSTGVLGAGIFWLIGFGAFVEVDERILNSTKHSKNTRMRISAAGTYINALTAGVAFLLILASPFLISLCYKQVPQVQTTLSPFQGGYNFGRLAEGDQILAVKEQTQLDFFYLEVDEDQGLSLNTILLFYSVGDNLTLKVHNPGGGITYRYITLGPRVPLEYVYISDTEILITYDYTLNRQMFLIVDTINGIPINRTSGITLWNFRTNYTLDKITLTTTNGINLTYQVDDGIPYIGILSEPSYMYKNDVGKFFTNLFPIFITEEIFWLFAISFSLAMFNMVGLPVFDGDRVIKELINWGVGENYNKKKTKQDTFEFEKEEEGPPKLELSEYRVEKINSIKITMKKAEEEGSNHTDEILLDEANYSLIDTIGDGYTSTVKLDLPEESKIQEGSKINVSYEYCADANEKVKKIILNAIRIFTLIIVLGNFILSFIRFGFNLFWLP